MGLKEDVLALAEELDGVSFKENCDQCLACGTALCRGDMECAESAHKACAKRLREIVERDAEDVTTMSAYDLLPEEDREALRWVRERPVLDADGVPIKKGDTVYLLTGEWCGEWPCLGFHGGEELEVFADGEASHVPGSVQCREKKKGFGFRGTCHPQPSQLTHTKPEIDTWQRIEEDAEKTVCEYFGANYDCANCPLEPARCDEEAKKDIVRRAKKLAGVDND